MIDIIPGSRTLRAVASIVVVIGLVATLGPVAAVDQTKCGDGEFHDPADELVADARGEDGVRVELSDLEPFSPATLVIDEGTCVNFVNADTNTFHHNVQIVADSSGQIQHQVGEGLPPGDNVTRAFDQAGTFYINCDFNPFHEATMHQVIEVR